MPPRAANEIRVVTPTNGAAPITVNDYDIDLPLGFGFRCWRILMPFVPWADEVVATGSPPTKAAIPLFEIEDLLQLLSFVLWEAPAATKRLVDTTF